MKCKPARDYVLETYPVKYRLGFPYEQWSHGENAKGEPVPLCNTQVTPWRYSLPGWLLAQHGVPSQKLCVELNAPGVEYYGHLYPTRYLHGFPKELTWWAEKVDLPWFYKEVVGDSSNMIIPDITGEPIKWFHLLTAINDMKWGLTEDGRSVTLPLVWRSYWLREACRIGGGIGIQIGQR